MTITGRNSTGSGDSLRSVTLPRPPYDPELGAFLEAQDAASPEPAAALSSSTLAGVREMLATFSPSIDAMIAGSGLEHIELSVPGEPGITLSVIRRPGVTTPAPPSSASIRRASLSRETAPAAPWPQRPR
jgi:hypothetical protein